MPSSRPRARGSTRPLLLLVTLTGAFVVLCNVKDGNIVQAMAQAQANSVDAWSYYQAKSTKQHFAEGMVDQLSIQRDTIAGPDRRRARPARSQDRRLHRQGQAVRRREAKDQRVGRGLPEAVRPAQLPRRPVRHGRGRPVAQHRPFRRHRPHPEALAAWRLASFSLFLGSRSAFRGFWATTYIPISLAKLLG